MKPELRFPWRRNRLGLITGLALVFLIIVALAPSVFAVHDPLQMSVERLAPPGGTFPLGSDRFGRDIESRIVFGMQVSLAVGFLSMICGATLGTLLGLLGGYFGGAADYLVMRTTDVLFAFPSVLMAIGIAAVLGTGLSPIVMAIAITFTPTFARVARAPVLSVKEREFVSAARAVGVSDLRILFKHILPNSWSPILVQTALSFSGAIVVEASLGFLGLGIQPPTPSLGSILNEARTYMEIAPWTVLYPGLALGFVILVVNLFGDSVRDTLDPHVRTQG